jgi:hypothetical protein
MWYCPAPNACPHKVSVALDMPNFKKHEEKKLREGKKPYYNKEHNHGQQLT